MTEQEKVQEQSSRQERFCSFCGLSLVPLDSNRFYVSKTCLECSKTTYTLPSPAVDGAGFVMSAGESLHISPQLFSLSLNPRNAGSFFRSGLLLAVRMLLSAGEPASESEIEDLLNLYKQKAELFLRNSQLLNDLDLDNEDNQEEIFRRISQDKECRELFALKLLFSCQKVEQDLEENNARQATWHLYHATMSHCFFEIGDFDFEETLWQGHLAHVFLTNVQDIAAQTPAQAQAIEKLKPLFASQTEITLHTWVKSQESIGGRLGISELSEETLRAVADYYLAQFERSRQEAQQEKEDKRKEEEAKRQERIAWNPIFIACISLATAISVALVNKLIPAFTRCR